MSRSSRRRSPCGTKEDGRNKNTDHRLFYGVGHVSLHPVPGKNLGRKGAALAAGVSAAYRAARRCNLGAGSVSYGPFRKASSHLRRNSGGTSIFAHGLYPPGRLHGLLRRDLVPAGFSDTAEDFEGLCAVLVENPSYCKAAGMHLKDEEFLRGKVPMTKSEVRSVSVAELELTEDAIVYDIGAGTGSVSIEIARAGEQIRVYAIEKNLEGVKLIDQNRKKFRTDGVRIIEGLAPHALEELETPTHAFVGGSSGNLREIVQLLQRKNPDVRIVINAISLETVSEVMGLVEEGILPDAEILQVSAARSKVLGRYHMMMGQNPVYIISAGGRKSGQV